LSADGAAAARRLFRRKLKKATGVMVLLEQDGTVVRLARNGYEQAIGAALVSGGRDPAWRDE
jgi:hypothetical protein